MSSKPSTTKSTSTGTHQEVTHFSQQKSSSRDSTPKKPPDISEGGESAEVPKSSIKIISKFLTVSAIILISFLDFGGFYTFDLPEALAEETIEEYNLSQTQLNLMYSIYYAPSIIVLIFSSKISGLLTTSFAALICCFISFAGNLLTDYGFYSHNFNVVLAGRFIFGSGGELLIVLAGCLMEEWFKGGSLTLATSIMEMLNLGGIALSNFITLSIYKKYRYVNSVYIFGTFVCAGSLILNVIFYFLDVYKTKKYSNHLKNLNLALKILEKKVKEEDEMFNQSHLGSSERKTFVSSLVNETVTMRLSRFHDNDETTVFESTHNNSDLDSILGFSVLETVRGRNKTVPLLKKSEDEWERKIDSIKSQIEELEVIIFCDFF